MRIVFRGTDEGDNLALEVMAGMSAVNALIRSRHTLCLQLKTGVAVEKLLSGKAQGTQIAGGDYDLSDSGIDSLLRKVEFSRVDKDSLELAARPITKEKFLLDVAKASSKPDFECEIAEKGDSLKKIMEVAEKSGLYSDIFIFADGTNTAQIEMLNSLVDMSILCIPQGGVDPVTAPIIPDKTIYLVTEFDRRSMFDEQRMKKAYGTKKLAVFPYNPEFKDAYNTDDIFRFVASNSQVKQEDANYDVIKSMQAILSGRNMDEEPPSFPILRRPNAIVPVRREKVSLDKTNIANKVGFFGFFKGRKKTTIEVLNDHVSGDEYVYDQEVIEVNNTAQEPEAGEFYQPPTEDAFESEGEFYSPEETDKSEAQSEGFDPWDDMTGAENTPSTQEQPFGAQEPQASWSGETYQPAPEGQPAQAENFYQPTMAYQPQQTYQPTPEPQQVYQPEQQSPQQGYAPEYTPDPDPYQQSALKPVKKTRKRPVRVDA